MFNKEKPILQSTIEYEQRKKSGMAFMDSIINIKNIVKNSGFTGNFVKDDYYTHEVAIFCIGGGIDITIDAEIFRKYFDDIIEYETENVYTFTVEE